MSGSTGTRRAVAEVRWDNDPGMISWVGNRPVHQFWPMISSYFRDLLLPPQRRPDENVVTWTWLELSQPEPLILPEFRALRRRLESEQQLFVENLARAGAGNGAGGLKGQVDVDQLGAVMGQVVSRLVACSDADLATFLCRTEHGLRIHSWGAAKAANPRFPDSTGLEIAGRVMVGGKPGLQDVILESGDGEHLAETPSDANGVFHFPKLVPGKYRLRARSTRGTFPPNGLAVVLNRTSVSNVILADRDAPAATAPRSRRARRSASQALVMAVAGGLALLLAGGTWFWFDRASDIATSQVEGQFASAGEEPTNVARPDEKRASATVALVASDSSARATPPVGRERDLVARATSITPVTALSVAPRKSDQRDPLDAAQDLGVDHLSRQAGPRPDPAGLALNPGAASAGAAGITPSSATSSPAAAASPNPAGPASAVAATLGASPAPGAGGALAAASAGGASAHPAASPTDTPAPTAASPSSSPMASLTAPSAPPTAQASIPNETVVTPPHSEADSQTKAALATIESAESVSPTKADTLTAESSEAGVKDPSSSAKATAEAKGEETTASGNRTFHDSDETKEDAPRALAERAGRERGDANRISPVSLAAGSRLTLHSAINLTRTVRLRLTPWRLQLLEDTILPTQPVRAGQVELVSELRQRLLAEQQARLPAALRESEVLNGVVLALPLEQAGESLAWRDHRGAVAANSKVENGRAEIVWTAENAPVEYPVRLMRANGDVIAEVRQEAVTRELVVRMAEDVRAWVRWIVRASAQENGLSDGASPRFSWRASTGGPVPPGWEPGVEGAGADHRLDLPIGGTMGSVAIHRYALFDRVSGWALVAELRQAADRPLSE